MPMEVKGISHEILKNVVKPLLTLLDFERRKYTPTLSEFLEQAGISRTVFFSHLKRNLANAGLVEFRVNPDRTITVHLTEKGRKLAECLKQCEDILKEIGVV